MMGLIDGFNVGSASDVDIIDIISNTDKRIKNLTNVKLRSIKLCDEEVLFGWVKPKHYLISYNWGDLGRGHVEVYNLESEIRELKLNKIL